MDTLHLTNETVSIELSAPAKLRARVIDYFDPWLRSGPTPEIVDSALSTEVFDPALCRDCRIDGSARPRMTNENEERKTYAIPIAACVAHAVPGYTAFLLPDIPAHVFVRADDSLRMVARAGDDDRLWAAAKELIQSHLLRPAMLRHGSICHAATIIVDNRAVLLCGPKGTGKTTTQLHLLSAGQNTAFCGSDRAYVVPHRSAVPLVVGHPGRIRAFPDTMHRFGFGARAIEQAEGRKFVLSTGDVLERFHTSVQTTAPLGLVLDLNRSAVAAEQRWHALQPHHYFDDDDPMVHPWAGRIAQAPPVPLPAYTLRPSDVLDLKPAAALDRIRALMASVPTRDSAST